MSRAAPLPRAERREAILDAVLPLVVDQGRAVSTRQIAEACGIAEGTIFRVFESKSELIDQAIQRALSPDVLLAHLAALASESDLTTLVTDIVAAYTARTQGDSPSWTPLPVQFADFAIQRLEEQLHQRADLVLAPVVGNGKIVVAALDLGHQAEQPAQRPRHRPAHEADRRPRWPARTPP